MNSGEKDPRFSKVLTDPRFLPMPSYKKKVKIDKRFNALFTSEDFGHRTILDKRGRPNLDINKRRSKNVMEQFYELSSEDSSDEDSDSPQKESEESDSDSTAPKTEKVGKKGTKIESESKSIGKKKKASESSNGIESSPVTENTEVPGKKRRRADKEKETDHISPEPVGKKPKQAVKSKTIQKSTDDQDNDDEKENLSNDNDDDEEMEEKEEEEEESSSSDSSSEEEEEVLPEYTAEFDLEETKVEHKWNEMHSDAVKVTDSTHRLAVCNMDWDFVKAHDLYVLFKSFAGEGGSVHSVIIYPSEFGKERMAEEAMLGPKEMRESLEKQKAEEEKEKAMRKNRRKKSRVMDQQRSLKADKQAVKVEREVLRNYQFNRLRYYYAVVDCSSVEVADNIYNECDDQEYQLSGVKLDLRFIPDDMTFDDTPKDSFTENQGLVEYTPRLFNSSALSQAKVEVTWDETDFDRLQKKMVNVLPKELEDIVEENRHADIIAPPESDSEFEDDGRPQWLKSVLLNEDGDDDDEDVSEERKIQLYRKVLMDKLLEEEEKEKKDNEVDKELEWQPGLKSALESKLKKTEKKPTTLVDNYIEKKREKKKKKRDLKKAESTPENDEEEDENNSEEDEVPDVIDEQLKEMMQSEGVDFDELEGKKKKQKQDRKKKLGGEEKKERTSEDEREAAELELLLMGDGDEKKLAKPEKVVKEGKLTRRQKKKQAMLAKKKLKEGREELTVDVEDPRFGAMFTSHHFHIDPSAPEFKKTQNMMKLVDEQIKRKPTKALKKTKKKMENGGSGGGVEGNGEEEEVEDSRAVSKKLVESLKRKMKK